MIWNIRGNAWSLMWCELLRKSQLIDWCDLLNHMFWSLRWCVHVQAFFDRSSMVRLGCGFFRSLCGCQPVFCLSQILVMSCFLKLYFCPLRFATTTCRANGLFSANRSTHAHRDGNKRMMILDLGLDMTLRSATLLRWEFQFFSRENHTSHTKMSDAQNMEVHKRWTTSVS